MARALVRSGKGGVVTSTGTGTLKSRARHSHNTDRCGALT